jgi:hypothetical protein
LFGIFFICFTSSLFTQPYVDLVNINNQRVETNYTDSFGGKNYLNNYALNITLPIKIDSSKTIIIRGFAESLNYTTEIKTNNIIPFTNQKANENIGVSTNFFAYILPVGIQYQTHSQKWKWLFLAMPKIAGTQGEAYSSYQFQPGVFALATKKINNNLSLKFGLFYNKEFFGNFIVPIISADWKINNRMQLYGTFPTFYKFEYALKKNVFYTGISYRSYTRSFLLNGAEHNYMRIDDMSIKAFLELYLLKSIVFYAEAGQMINYCLLDYKYNTRSNPENEINNSILFRKNEIPFFINFGLAYRIRFDR